jgi:hypothetical protein
MAEISLVVTRAVLDHVGSGNLAQRQIALRAPSPDIRARVSGLARLQRRYLRLGGCITLVAGDPGAIWRAHNATYAEDFDALYELLARHPDMPMRFLCELE